MADQIMASAAAAYARATQGMAIAPTQDTTQTGESDFSSLLKQAVREAADVAYKGERMSIAAAAGKADVTEVITAMSEAEVMLQAVTTVRDKVISAYQEIIKMPI
jgi:flagellar hook-basal body complex protein FliE